VRAALLVAVAGCVTQRQLGSMDEREHLDAIRALPAAQARDLVPQLEKWAAAPRGQDQVLARAALEALIRADTEEAFQVTLLQSERDPWLVGEAWAAVPTERSCHALARLALFWPEDASVPVSAIEEPAARALGRWPCSRALEPFLAHPRATAWRAP
jgi:hypothetical protein